MRLILLELQIANTRITFRHHLELLNYNLLVHTHPTLDQVCLPLGIEILIRFAPMILEKVVSPPQLIVAMLAN